MPGSTRRKGHGLSRQWHTGKLQDGIPQPRRDVTRRLPPPKRESRATPHTCATTMHAEALPISREAPVPRPAGIPPRSPRRLVRGAARQRGHDNPHTPRSGTSGTGPEEPKKTSANVGGASPGREDVETGNDTDEGARTHHREGPSGCRTAPFCPWRRSGRPSRRR